VPAAQLTPGEKMLELEDVTKAFPGPAGPLTVLRGVSLAVLPGETVAVLGPSGSGKSTLLNLMGALDVPDSGTVRFEGKDLSGRSEAERAAFRNRRVGFVFQAHHLLPQLTVWENVLVPAVVGGVGEAVEERARRLLDRVGLAGRADRMPGTLSGGERQRTAVVRALVNGPALLLADEPTGSLDRATAGEIADLLLDLNREEGTALVVVTHSDALADRMGRVLSLRDGRLADARSKE
jgi:predicted ABC-type transport system involved in lysophospholipase L1 biosynthesis ATPase subunit